MSKTFIGRTELLAWVGSTVGHAIPPISKVEECASGVVYAYLLESIHPGSVQMAKLNANAKLEHEYLKNYKVLQNAFSKLGISRAMEVEKLVKGRPQDNLEFLQWFYALANGSATGTAPPVASADPIPIAMSSNSNKENQSSHSRGNVTERKMDPKSETKDRSEKDRALRAENAELRLTVEGLEKERDFYFSKLRDIEILCQTREGDVTGGSREAVLLEEIRKILYATEEDFVVPVGQ
jgi:RP/EB family microtubule-associated protein